LRTLAFRHALTPKRLRRDSAAGSRKRSPRARPAAPGVSSRVSRRTWHEGADQGHRSAARPKHYYSIYQKDDRPRKRGVRRHLRTWWGIPPSSSTAWRDCYAALGTIQPARWKPGTRAGFKGLRRDAEVQHVPVAAHHRHRPGRQAGRAADPHLGACTKARGVRRRRALGSTRKNIATRTAPAPGQRHLGQGRQQGRGEGQPGRRGDGVAPPARRLAARDRGPGGVSSTFPPL